MYVNIVVTREDATVAIAEALSNDIVIDSHGKMYTYVKVYINRVGLSCIDAHLLEYALYIPTATRIVNKYYKVKPL